MRIKDIHIIKEGSQIVGLTGSTLYGLERKLKPYGREPHSIIGSTSVSLPIVDSEIILGRWQRLFFVELDCGRSRRLFVQIQDLD